MQIKFKAITTSGQWVVGDVIHLDERTMMAGVEMAAYDKGNAHENITLECIEVIPETVCVGFDIKGKTLFHGDQYNHGGGYFTTLQFKDGCLFSVYKHPEDGEEIPVFEMDFENAEYVGNIFDQLVKQ